mmetsp:Transcript_78678/g.188778  ORF Transcript_78678/g.188778 Transcript_78678/m.188778 type:complete len:202 (+) Transcript_78678:1148-1753(+)
MERSAWRSSRSRSNSSWIRCISSNFLATKASTTAEGSCATSRLICGRFLTSLARLPNSREQRVSSRSDACTEQVMMRQVLELPPKLSASKRVSMESRYGTSCIEEPFWLVKRWMTNASCESDLLISPASRRWSRGVLSPEPLPRRVRGWPRGEANSVDIDRFSRSLPAKSTKCSLPRSVAPISGSRWVAVSVKIRWDLLLW